MTAYFPPLAGAVACRECDRADCMSRDRFQRNRRDFTVTSGRCPRLPDLRGYVDREDRALYEATFPLVHAKREDGRLTLTLASSTPRPRSWSTWTGSGQTAASSAAPSKTSSYRRTTP